MSRFYLTHVTCNGNHVVRKYVEVEKKAGGPMLTFFEIAYKDKEEKPIGQIGGLALNRLTSPEITGEIDMMLTGSEEEGIIDIYEDNKIKYIAEMSPYTSPDGVKYTFLSINTIEKQLSEFMRSYQKKPVRIVSLSMMEWNTFKTLMPLIKQSGAESAYSKLMNK